MRPVLALLAALLLAPALRAQRPEEPPPPAPVTPWTLPPVREMLLPNGLRLVVIEQPRQPVISVVLALPAGTGYDPAGKEGLADLYSHLLTRGAGSRSAESLASTLENVGGSFGASADPDVMTLQADVLSMHATLAFELVADAALRPSLDSASIELVRRQSLSAVEAELQGGSSLGRRVLLVGGYRQHPYARRPTPASLLRISRADLVEFQQARIRPAGSTLVVAGNVTLAEAQRQATAAFGAWKGVRPAALPVPAAGDPPGTLLLIHQPGAQAASLVFGTTTFAATDTSYYAAHVLTQILGEGRNSRLARLLGDQHGWSLLTGTAFLRTARLGLFQVTADVPADVADSAVREIRQQMERLRTELVPARELERARDAITGAFPLRLQTMSQLAAAVSEARMVGLPPAWFGRYRTRIAAVSAASVRNLARRTLDPVRQVSIVVGDAARLYQPLSALGPTRILGTDGRPLTPEEVQPKPAAFALHFDRLVPRTDSLVIVADGRGVGLQVTGIQRSGDSVVYTERTAVGAQLNQTTRVTFDTAGRVRRLDQSGKVRGQDTRITLDYGQGRVRGQAKVVGPEGPRSFSVDSAVTAGVIDDNAIQAVLPTLDWAINTRWTFPVFASGENRTRMLTLTVSDIETVQVPAGAFEAYRADMEGGTQRVSFYVTTTAPHRLVKVSLAGSPIEFLAVNP